MAPEPPDGALSGPPRSLLAWIALIPIGCVLVVLGVRCQKSRLAPSASPTPEAYSRKETPEEAAYYEPGAPLLKTTPPALRRLLDRIAEAAALERRAEAYPTEGPALARAAAALALAASEAYGVTLSLEDPDAGQLDRLVDEHLVASWSGGRIPDEPLLHYALGAFWGEWLVAHRGFEWRLHPPLRPRQRFPDRVHLDQAVCVHPFSQITKKLSDPAGHPLALAATPASLKHSFPPFLLTAALADAEQAVREATPEAFRRARQAESDGRRGEAVALYEKALAHPAGSARLYALAAAAAWDADRWDLVEAWLRQGLELQPRHPLLSHRLAQLYAKMPGSLERALPLLESALAEDSSYARARLTLAACLRDLGRRDEARRQARWVAVHDPALKDEAAALLR